MGMDSEVLSPSDVASMAPISPKALSFPRWEVPSWADPGDTDKQDEEYFNEYGALIGGIRPFANKWSAWTFIGTQTDGTVSHVTGKDLGIFYYKEQAKKSIEDYSNLRR